MKYAFMSFSCPELSLEEMLAVAEKYGYDGIEPRIDSKHCHGIERSTDTGSRDRIHKRIAGSKVKLACIATSCKYADPTIRDENIDQTHEAIDLAADVGAPCIRVFGGVIPKNLTREQAVDSLSQALAAVAEHAHQRNITVCLETHDDWCHPEHVARVLEKVNHPAIAVNWDIMHPVRVAKVSIDQSFETLKPWVRHLHIHDGIDEGNNLVFKPIGQGSIDHHRALELLIGHNYEGSISGEWISWESFEKHLPRELAILKRYEQTIGK